MHNHNLANNQKGKYAQHSEGSANVRLMCINLYIDPIEAQTPNCTGKTHS